MFFIGLFEIGQELYDRIKLRIDTMVEKAYLKKLDCCIHSEI